MIDYVKIDVLGANVGELLNNPILEFKRSVSEKTGLLDNKTESNYHHCKITVYDSGRIIFSGSIHKMYNSIAGIKAPNKDPKGYNGNQYVVNEIDYIRQHLKYLFKAPPNQMIIHNIEYGLNLSTSFDPQKFICGLLLFGTKPFEYRYNQYFAQSIHQQYYIKIYNKGNQYHMPINTLRFEIKVIKMEHQKEDVGICSMEDITPETMQRAIGYLKKQLLKVLYYDNTINKKELTKGQRNKVKEYSNPRYWQKLTYQECTRNKVRLNKIINQNSQNLKAELIDLINQKCIEIDQPFPNTECIDFNSSSIVLIPNLLPQRKYSNTAFDL